MNEAGKIVGLSARSQWGDDFSFSARILYWWEVQNIRMGSVITDKISVRRFLDRSRLYGQMVDTFLEDITDDGNTISRSDLLSGESWCARLHPTVIQPIYEAYNERCGPTTRELDMFRDQVRAYFDPTVRPEGIYIVPPEIWEALILSQMGGITLSEIRRLSYTEMRRLLVVVEVMSGTTIPSPSPQTPSIDPFSTMIPMNVFSNPSLSMEQATMMATMGNLIQPEGIMP